MTIEEAKELLAKPENAAELAKMVTFTIAKSVLETSEEGKQFLSTHAEDRVQQAIESSSKKNLAKWQKELDAKVETEIDKRFPQASEADKKTQALEAKLAKMEQVALEKDLLIKATSYATEKGYPTKHINRFLGADEEETLANVEAYGKDWIESVKVGVQVDVLAKNKEAGQVITPEKDKVDKNKGVDARHQTRDEFINSGK